MDLLFDIAQIVTGLLLIISILLQSRGDGLGAAFGGGDSVVSPRRGAEKTLFNISIVLAAVFIALAALRMFVL